MTDYKTTCAVTGKTENFALAHEVRNFAKVFQKDENLKSVETTFRKLREI